ncbi:hypothetical protein V8C26DRAFT_386367 [Trichoderma gracile]
MTFLEAARQYQLATGGWPTSSPGSRQDQKLAQAIKKLLLLEPDLAGCLVCHVLEARKRARGGGERAREAPLEGINHASYLPSREAWRK